MHGNVCQMSNYSSGTMWQCKLCAKLENGCHAPANDRNQLSWLLDEATKTAGLDHSLVPRKNQLLWSSLGHGPTTDQLLWFETNTAFLNAHDTGNISHNTPGEGGAAIAGSSRLRCHPWVVRLHPGWDLHQQRVRAVQEIGPSDVEKLTT